MKDGIYKVVAPQLHKDEASASGSVSILKPVVISRMEVRLLVGAFAFYFFFLIFLFPNF